MQLDKISEAIHSTERPNHSICIYGSPKTGKTQLVGTAAEIKAINRIYWFDLENGAETLLHSGLSKEAMAKIELIRIPDTRMIPRAIETLLKCFTVPNKEHIICEKHGKIACLECKVDGQLTGVSFCLSKLTHNDLVVIDSASQLGTSALNLTCAGKDVLYKPEFDDWGAMGKYLSDILGVIQACQYVNTVVIAHIQAVEENINGVKKDKMFPLIGTRNYSMNCGKFFGTVVLTEIKLRKHKAGSSSTYKADNLTGSRVNAKIEDGESPTMRTILVDGGILK